MMIARFFSVNVVSRYFVSSLAFLFIVLTLLIQPARAEEEAEVNAQVQYIEMRPSFVINYGGPATKMKFAKVDISLRVNSNSAGENVKSHMPFLRNEIVLLLSRQTEEAMANTAGREILRGKALERLNDVLQEEVGVGAIGDILFTTFVVQS